MNPYKHWVCEIFDPRFFDIQKRVKNGKKSDSNYEIEISFGRVWQLGEMWEMLRSLATEKALSFAIPQVF